MITSYEIRENNNEEILYIYLDFDNEFGKINFKEITEKLEDTIKDFIENNKIIFTGTTVALVVGSTVVGNVLLNNDRKEIVDSENIVSIEKLDQKKLEEIYEIKDEDKVEENKNKEDVKVEKEIKKNSNISSNKVVKNTNKNTKTGNIDKQEKKTQQTTIIKEEKKQESVKKETNQETKKDNKIYIKIKRKNGEIQNIELEEYVIGVVSAEMPASFHEQALMSQAIIARTYALNSNSKGKILTDNESTQSYKSNNELKSIWGSNYNMYYDKIKNAVINTKGMYLTYNGKYIEAVYHSTSNGYTEDSKNVWGNSFPYLVSVESTYDSLNPSFLQQKSISYEELSNKLNMDINIDTEFNILDKTSSNRVSSIEINGKVYKGVDLRKILGLRSTDFDIEKTNNYVIFTTRGYGHGVGLSQYGANGMAKNGYSYTQILKHYYKGVSISHL